MTVRPPAPAAPDPADPSDRSDPSAGSGLDCAAVVELLPLFVGEDLAVDAAKAVRSHLRGCPCCRRTAGPLLQAVQRLRQAGSAAPAGVGPQFFADLQRDIEAGIRATVASQSDPGTRWRSWAALAAAALLSITAGLWFAWPTNEEPWPSLLRRAAIPVPGDPGLLPHGGGALVPVGFDRDPAPCSTGDAAGMGGRLWLRELEQEDGFEPSLLGTAASAPRPTGRAAATRPR